jgi:hypothetical protein
MAVDRARQPAAAVRRPQQLGRQHGRQRQRQEGGEGHGRGDGRRQLHEQPAHDSRQEQQRREHRDQHDGGRHHAKKTWRARAARPRRGLARIHAALDVLRHHDGVVDHQPDRQHQRQSVRRFSEKPSGASTMKVASRQMGATTVGMIAPSACPGR